MKTRMTSGSSWQQMPLLYEEIAYDDAIGVLGLIAQALE